MDRSATSRRPEVPPTNFHSILYHGKVPADNGQCTNPPDFFTDLNLDQIVDTITTGKDEYELKPFYYAPLRDVADVCYRQAVLRDLEDALLYSRIDAFANGMRDMRRRLPDKDTTYYKHQQERFFLEEAPSSFCRRQLIRWTPSP